MVATLLVGAWLAICWSGYISFYDFEWKKEDRLWP